MAALRRPRLRLKSVGGSSVSSASASVVGTGGGASHGSFSSSTICFVCCHTPPPTPPRQYSSPYQRVGRIPGARLHDGAYERFRFTGARLARCGALSISRTPKAPTPARNRGTERRGEGLGCRAHLEAVDACAVLGDHVLEQAQAPLGAGHVAEHVQLLHLQRPKRSA